MKKTRELGRTRDGQTRSQKEFVDLNHSLSLGKSLFIRHAKERRYKGVITFDNVRTGVKTIG